MSKNNVLCVNTNTHRIDLLSATIGPAVGAGTDVEEEEEEEEEGARERESERETAVQDRNTAARTAATLQGVENSLPKIPQPRCHGLTILTA